jgi:hypothetical protein
MAVSTNPLFLLTTAALLIAVPEHADAQQPQAHRLEIPGDPMTNNIIFITFAGPPDGYTVRVRAHITFATGGTFTHDDLEMRINAPIEPQFPEWVVQGGADFGWPSSTGTATGDAETFTLNGEIASSPFPWSIWDVSIGPVLGSGQDGVTGQFIDSYIEVSFAPEGAGPGVPFCFGAACPCGNDGGATEGCLHSGGQGMTITGSGTASIASDDLTLHVQGAPPVNSGIFYSGTLSLAPGNTLFDGLQCASGDVRRYRGRSQTDGNVQDTGFVAQDPSGTYFAAGTTYHFQYWSRDVAAGPSPCGSGANFSPGYAMLMTP